MSWNNLTIAQKSQLMNIMRRNGITSLSDMKNIYDSQLADFNTSLEEATDTFGRPVSYTYAGGGKKKPRFDKPVSWYIQQRPDLYPDLAKMLPEYLDKYFYINDEGQIASNLAYHKYTNRNKSIKDAIGKIGYNQDNEIMLTTDAANARYRTGRISTDILDYIYDNAAKAKVPFRDALGLAGKESTLGIGRGYKRGNGISPIDLFSFWVGIGGATKTNKQMEKLTQVYKDMYEGKKVDQKLLDTSEFEFQKMHDNLHEFAGDNWVKAAYDYYKAGKYNPGEKGYDADVIRQGDAILSDRAVQKWLKTKQPYVGRGFVGGGNLYYDGGGKGGGSRGESQKTKIDKVADFYHRNADLLSPRFHRAAYEAIKEASFTEDEPIRGAIRNFLGNYFDKNNKNGSPWQIDNAFLMSPEQQEKALGSIGFNKVGNQDYGLVNAAVTKYKNATGRDVPIYQYGEDDIAREDLIPLNNNIYSRFVDTEQGPGIHNTIEMGDVGSSPIRFYRDKDGNLYYKRWDFFDHGNYSRNDYTEQDDQYVTPQLTQNSQKYGNALDAMGNPYVKTTGYKRVQNIHGALQQMPHGMKFPYTDEEFESIANRVKSGEFDIKAQGGSIHIDPSKKGTFTAAATKHNMGVQEFASYVSAHPDAFSSAMGKKAAFAKAATKFKHAFGGIKF